LPTRRCPLKSKAGFRDLGFRVSGVRGVYVLGLGFRVLYPRAAASSEVACAGSQKRIHACTQRLHEPCVHRQAGNPTQRGLQGALGKPAMRPPFSSCGRGANFLFSKRMRGAAGAVAVCRRAARFTLAPQRSPFLALGSCVRARGGRYLSSYASAGSDCTVPSGRRSPKTPTREYFYYIDLHGCYSYAHAVPGVHSWRENACVHAIMCVRDGHACPK
jgi:hypothetical protein